MVLGGCCRRRDILPPLRRLILIALSILGGLVGLTALAVATVGYLLSAPAWRGPVSDDFDGKQFMPPRAVPHGGFGAFMRWQKNRHPPRWEDRATPPGPAPPARVEGGRMRVTFINHATVLV